MQDHVEVEKIPYYNVGDFLPPIDTLYRVSRGNQRFYIREGVPFFYSGYSTWTKGVIPMGEGLKQWYKKNIASDIEEVSEESKAYGSMFQAMLVEIESKKAPLAYVVQTLEERIFKHGGSGKYVSIWRYRALNDLFAWQSFKAEHNVEIIACELPVWSDKYRIATCLDFVATMRVKENPRKRKDIKWIDKIVLIDVKTGDSGAAYDEYIYQLEFGRYALYDLYGLPNAIEIYNWHPKKREISNGGFAFVNQSGKISADMLHHKMKENQLMGICYPSSPWVYFKVEDGVLQKKEVDPNEWLKEWNSQFGDQQKRATRELF